MTAARSAHSSPPMRVWFYAVMVAVILIGGFNLVAQQVSLPTLDAFTEHNHQRIERFEQLTRQHPERLKVVILGNSTMKYGTAIDEETLTFDGHEEIQVLRIINNWASFTDFAPFSDDLLALKPDLILLQADLIGRVRLLDYSSKPAQLQSYLKWRSTGRGSWNPHKVDQNELQTDQVDYDDQSEARFERRRKSVTEWQGIDLEGSSAAQAKQFVNRARAASVPVVLHFTPVTVRAGPFQEQMQTTLSPVVNEMSAQPGVTLLTFPDTLEDRHFSDFVHMNAAGREQYMNWLVPELKQIIEKQAAAR